VDTRDFEHGPDPLQVMINHGQAMLDLGRHADAIRIWQNALLQDPDNWHLLCSIAFAFLQMNDPKNCLSYADRAIAVNPEIEWPHRLRSISLRKRGDKRGSLAAALRAAAIDPEEPRVHHELAMVYLAYGKMRKAFQEAERMREIAPEMDLTWEALARLSYHRKRWRDVERYSRKALELDPESYAAMNFLGLSLSRQNRNREAVDYLDRAAKLNPSDTPARHNLKEAVSWYLIPGGRITIFVAALVFWFTRGELLKGSIKLWPGWYVIGPFAILLLIIGFVIHRHYKMAELPESVQLFAKARPGGNEQMLNVFGRILVALVAPGVAMLLWSPEENRLDALQRFFFLNLLIVAAAVVALILNKRMANTMFVKIACVLSVIWLTTTSAALIFYFKRRRSDA